MEGKPIDNSVSQLDSDCKDSEDRHHSSVSCNSGKMGLASQSSGVCVDVKQSDVTLVASTSASGSGRDNSARRKTFGGNGRTRKEKPTAPENSKSTKKISKFWNFLSKKKMSPEADKCDQQDVGDECVDDQSSTVSCLCTGLRRLQLQLRVADEEMGASDYAMDDDESVTSDVITTCQSNGLPLDEAPGVPEELRADSIPESAQRHSLPPNPSFASAAVVIDDVTELFGSRTAPENNVAALGHRAIYPHLSYGNGSLSSSSSVALASDASCSNHTWTISSNSSESHPVHSSLKGSVAVNENLVLDGSEWKLNMGFIPRTIHTQVDYIHCLVPDLMKITNCSYYWGVMDRYEAERLLDNRPEGTFLLRDSAQEEFLFSVSFRRYSRSLHARVEQWNHKFSFDSHDPSVYASLSVSGLVEHYKDPACCMFFEPMLTLPLVRTFPFSLQHLCRAAICSMTTYDGISYLPLPKSLHQFLQYYHYKQRVRVRRFESLHS